MKNSRREWKFYGGPACADYTPSAYTGPTLDRGEYVTVLEVLPDEISLTREEFRNACKQVLRVREDLSIGYVEDELFGPEKISS